MNNKYVIVKNTEHSMFLAGICETAKTAEAILAGTGSHAAIGEIDGDAIAALVKQDGKAIETSRSKYARELVERLHEACITMLISAALALRDNATECDIDTALYFCRTLDIE